MAPRLAASRALPIVRCAWCAEPADRPLPAAAAVSHGICPDCLRRCTGRSLRLAEPLGDPPADSAALPR